MTVLARAEEVRKMVRLKDGNWQICLYQGLDLGIGTPLVSGRFLACWSVLPS